jgi:hypothetical protein
MKAFAKFQKHRKIGHYSKILLVNVRLQEKFICEYFPRHFEQLHLFILNIVSTTRYQMFGGGMPLFLFIYHIFT